MLASAHRGTAVRKSKQRRRSLKLKLEPMPQSLWGKNLRTALGRNRWDTLRLSVAQKSCAICGGTEQLEAHEVWDYRERPRLSVAKLLRVETTCTKCHDVIHWGNTIRLAEAGKISRGAILALRRHFRTVNKCLQKDFDRHIIESNVVAISRSIKQWRIDWGGYASTVKEATEARAAWAVAHPMHDIDSDYQAIGPGHHMPSKCPSCGSYALRLIEQGTSDMSEGQEADYSQGTWGTAICGNCGHEVDWGF
jgi:hypothetical protein